MSTKYAKYLFSLIHYVMEYFEDHPEEKDKVETAYLFISRVARGNVEVGEFLWKESFEITKDTPFGYEDYILYKRWIDNF